MAESFTICDMMNIGVIDGLGFIGSHDSDEPRGKLPSIRVIPEDALQVDFKEEYNLVTCIEFTLVLNQSQLLMRSKFSITHRRGIGLITPMRL